MSKFKVGDRVSLTGVVVEVDNGDRQYQTLVKWDGTTGDVDEVGNWLHVSTRPSRLVPKRRKRAPVDRVMVAARLLAGMLANPSGPIQSNAQNGWGYVNCGPESLSQAALELADALIAEVVK